MESEEKIKIKLGGMTCASCALKIETKLKNMDGVSSSTVNFANEEATVEFNPSITNYKKFNEAILDLGYKSSLAKVDIKVTSQISESEFDEFVNKVGKIDGIQGVRGNYNARKLFIEFNELKIDENKVYNQVKILGYEIEKAAGALDKEIETYRKELRYRLRILFISLAFTLVIAPISMIFMEQPFEIKLLLFFLAIANYSIAGSFFLGSDIATKERHR